MVATDDLASEAYNIDCRKSKSQRWRSCILPLSNVSRRADASARYHMESRDSKNPPAQQKSRFMKLKNFAS